MDNTQHEKLKKVAQNRFQKLMPLTSDAFERLAEARQLI
jgi:hypothetical protein